MFDGQSASCSACVWACHCMFSAVRTAKLDVQEDVLAIVKISSLFFAMLGIFALSVDCLHWIYNVDTAGKSTFFFAVQNLNCIGKFLLFFFFYNGIVKRSSPKHNGCSGNLPDTRRGLSVRHSVLPVTSLFSICRDSQKILQPQKNYRAHGSEKKHKKNCHRACASRLGRPNSLACALSLTTLNA